MKFTVTTTPDLPKILRAGSNANVHEFPWAECAKVAERGEVANFTIPTAYWVERGDEQDKLKAANLKTRIRNHFNSWVAKDEKERAKLELLISSTPGSLDLTCYVKIKAA